MPTAPDKYTQNGGKVARMQAGKAGLRPVDRIKATIP
jgi:hypothetical protein